MERIVGHHVRYKEIHGIDEVVVMTESEHRKLHNRLRQEGVCSIPSNELDIISTKAHSRTEKRIRCVREYSAVYDRLFKKNIYFTERLAPNIRLRETIVYNEKSGSVCVSSNFYTDHTTELYIIQERNEHKFLKEKPYQIERLPMNGEAIDFPEPPGPVLGLLALEIGGDKCLTA